MSRYVIRGGKEGKERLKLISQVLLPTTAQLLHTVRLGQGMKCLDVGCGGGFVTLLMASIVGPQGKAVGRRMLQRVKRRRNTIWSMRDFC